MNTQWTNRTAPDGAAVIERLTGIQNRHRLAMHMVEYGNHVYHADPKTLHDLDAVPADKITETLLAGTPSLFSMSLLPTRQSQLGMQPYNTYARTTNNYGYLFDLSQARPNAARVVRAYEKSLMSDPEGVTADARLTKQLKLELLSKLPALNALYHAFRPTHISRWAARWLRAVGGPDGAGFTEQQLDILGGANAGPNNAPNEVALGTVGLNEVLVAADSSHIAGIFVPRYRGGRNNAQDILNGHLVRLQAALVGLEHLDTGRDWPVVIYDVETATPGALHYVGQGELELNKAALEAIKALGKNVMTYAGPEGDRLAEAIKQRFNLEVTELACGIKTSVEAIDQQLEALTAAPAPSPQSGRTSPG